MVYATFGRFNVIHEGHRKLIETVVSKGHHIVGISTGKKNRPILDRIDDLEQALGYGIRFDPFSDMYSFVATLSSEYDYVIFYVGQDQMKSASSIAKGFDNVELRIIPRDGSEPSSSRVRELFNQFNLPRFIQETLREGLSSSREESIIQYKAVLLEQNV
jgi:hypothetical protein